MLQAIYQSIWPPLRLRLNRVYFRPYLPRTIDYKRIIRQATHFFDISKAEVQQRFDEYEMFHQQKKYAEHLGEHKTLNFAEAFLIYLAVRSLCPRQVVEIGTQHGKSTRRILDMLQLAGSPARVTCFDITNEVRHFATSEAKLMLHDVTEDIQETVLDAIQPDIIYLDAHPYPLLKHTIEHFLAYSTTHNAILAIHDCGPGLYKRDMEIPKDAPELISSHTGHWERHVLSEVFGIANDQLDFYQSDTHRLAVFSTRHGLAMIKPLDL